MTILIVKAVDADPCDDPDQHARRYLRGDVVDELPDGTVDLGRKVGLPLFYVVRMPDAAHGAGRQLLDEEDQDDQGNPVAGPDGRPKMVRRRRWMLDVDNLPTPHKATLLTTGTVVMVRGLIRAHFLRKRDGAQFPNL